MTALPKRWSRTVAAWPDEPRDEIAIVEEASPGICSVSSQIMDRLLRDAGFHPIPDDIVITETDTP